jgi:hypothetical protein
MHAMSGIISVKDTADIAALLKPLRDAGGASFAIRCLHPWFGIRFLAPRPRQSGAPALAIACPPRVLRQVLGQMDMPVIHENRAGSFEIVFEVDRGAVPPSPPPVTVYDHCRVLDDHCVLDGRRLAIKRGNWAFYVPELKAKILHARNGNRFCLHASRPSADLLESGDGAQRLGPYCLQDWRDALSTSVLRRAAENYTSAKRLAAAGVGPAVNGCLVVRALDYGDGNPSLSAGIHIADLTAYARRRPAQLEDLARAGVTLDRIRSALRQQIRGYVSDLDSVIGVYPIDAEDEVRAVEDRLRAVL